MLSSCRNFNRFLPFTRSYGVFITPPKEYVPDVLKEILSHEIMQNQDYFQVNNLFTVKDLFDARVHYGHTDGSLDKRMLPFIYGSRLGHIIFDLDKTAVYLRRALNFVAHIAYRGGIILFLTRNSQHSLLVENTARECQEFAYTRLWRKGVFTNSTVQFGAITRLPDLCIFLSSMDSVMEQHLAIRDSAKMLIPTVAILDSNSNPNIVTYPVPGNDDSLVSIQLYCKLFKEAILRGKEKRNNELKSS